MKLIVRTDDLGLADEVNHGIFKSIKDGIVTSTGLMTNMPNAKGDYNLIKEFKHVSIGQHSNASK
ncbi:ChbG/HpnK family deacetylase [uncultured Clostridium sp.]|uniref:ChbG/HpnK family deacetylase n=1 Tax=uncultured Clostridium sp. TaxID=59620 RepID=UPI0028EAD71E|nr:ChbG/HpnK family deacetylase [uncultured Clostridium sp.]